MRYSFIRRSNREDLIDSLDSTKISSSDDEEDSYHSKPAISSSPQSNTLGDSSDKKVFKLVTSLIHAMYIVKFCKCWIARNLWCEFAY